MARERRVGRDETGGRLYGRGRLTAVVVAVIALLAACAEASGSGDPATVAAVTETRAPTTSAARPATTSLAAPTPPVAAEPVGPVDVHVVGDSLSMGLFAPLRAALDQHVGATSHALLGGPTHSDPGMAWEEQVGEVDADVVVLFFGTWESWVIEGPWGTDLTTAAGVEQYRNDYVDPFLDDATDAVEHVIWVGMPMTGDAEQSAWFARLNAIWADAANAHPDVTWIDAAARFGGRYLEIDDTVDPPQRLVGLDGLHQCPHGAARVADAVLEVLEAEFGVTARPGWRDGLWPLDPEAFQFSPCPAPEG